MSDEGDEPRRPGAKRPPAATSLSLAVRPPAATSLRAKGAGSSETTSLSLGNAASSTRRLRPLRYDERSSSTRIASTTRSPAAAMNQRLWRLTDPLRKLGDPLTLERIPFLHRILLLWRPEGDKVARLRASGRLRPLRYDPELDSSSLFFIGHRHSGSGTPIRKLLIRKSMNQRLWRLCIPSLTRRLRPLRYDEPRSIANLVKLDPKQRFARLSPR